MDIEKLPDVVKKFFEATAAPATELAVTIVALTYALGLDHIPTELRALSDRVKIVPSEGVKNALEFYGINEILPIALLFVLIGLTHTISWLLRAVGQVVPGRLIPNPTLLMVKYIERHDLLKLMRILGGKGQHLEDFKVFEGFNDTKIEKGSNADRTKSLTLTGFDDARQIRYSNFIKGLTTVAIASALIVRLLIPGRPFLLGRLILIIIITLAVLFFLAMQEMRDRREYLRKKVNDYLSFNGDQSGEGDKDEYHSQNLDAYEKQINNAWRVGGWAGPSNQDLTEMVLVMRKTLSSISRWRARKTDQASSALENTEKSANTLSKPQQEE